MSQLEPNSVFEGLPKLVLSLTILHLSACVLFILGYAVGFGGNIISLFRPNDIFTVGLKDLAFVYLTVSAIAVVKLIRIVSDKPYASDKVEAIDDPQERAKARQTLMYTQRILTIFGYCFVAITAILTIYGFWIDARFKYVVMTWAIMMLIILQQDTIKKAFNLEYKTFEIVDFVLTLYLVSATFGAIAGSAHKASKYDRYSESTIFCQKFAIIRSISDYFIAIDDQDEKLIINSRCEVIFKFSPTTEIDDNAGVT